MRKFLILVVTALNAFGQTDDLNAKIVLNPNKFEETANDTIPQVSYINPKGEVNKPAFYVNGKYTSETFLRTINPLHIDSINVVKRDVEIDGNKYYGQVYVQLKKDYRPKLISLTDLKLKFTNPTNIPSIFMIDNELISGDYNKCVVDENYILKIIVEKVENREENLQVNLIRLLTKTEENIKDSKQIWIRGTEDLMLEK